MTTADYLTKWANEKVVYGGQIVTRAEMIRHLQATSQSLTNDPIRRQKIVNAYLAGFARKP